MPFRVAMALQEDGWWLRQAITICKNNPMPECLSPDTHVFVRTGGIVERITLDELSAMEPLPEILTPDGWRRINHVWEVVKESAIRFKAATVSDVTCSAEHRWPVSHDRRRSISHLKAAADLKAEGYNDYLLHHTIDEWIEPTLTEFRGEPLDYDLGWLLGIYAAEGGFNAPRGHACKFTLHREERQEIDRIISIVEQRFCVRPTERTAANYTQITFHSSEWHAIARAILPGKCASKELNLTYALNTPKEFRQGLWDGYVAGDGSERRGSGVIVTSASIALRDSMAVLASALGLVTSKGSSCRLDARTGKHYRSHWLLTPYRERRQTKKGSTARQLTIRSKETVEGPIRLIDIEVEGGLFLIDDGLVTHNSVRDRCTSATEMLFMLTRAERYYYDADAIREPQQEWTGQSATFKRNGSKREAAIVPGQSHGTHRPDRNDTIPNPAGRNKRNWWVINTQGTPDLHFATMPEAMVAPAILAGSSEWGVCSACGAPFVRDTENQRGFDEQGNCRGCGRPRNKHKQGEKSLMRPHPETFAKGTSTMLEDGAVPCAAHQTTGWRQSCRCEGADNVPAVVLDPFVGSGTVCKVATRLGRRSIGIDLKEEYLEISRRRNSQLGLLL